jgi:4-amino-4-deoxy-L-arabinose transferase-like glycosyltransferase
LNSDIRASEEKRVRAGAKAAVGDRPGLRNDRWPQLLLVLFTVACLLPFCGKPFHIDDPIFLWTAQHITHHPLDFYGFTATWWSSATPMWQIQQNPPLAAYYMAIVGSVAGWSERALHIGFLLPAVVVVLATYHLARRFTRGPWIAAMATLVAPGFLVSATGLMCDVSMLALWLLAIVFWMRGLDEGLKPAYLAISAFLITACALTKYFGMSLIPLLLVYTLLRQRSFRRWIAYLAIPVLILVGYEFYTYKLYGYGLIWLAAGNASTTASGLHVVHRHYLGETETLAGRILVGLAFIGGCVLPALTFIPLLWSRRGILWGGIVSGLLALFFFRGWIDLGKVYQYEAWLHASRGWISAQLFFYLAGAISVVALAVADLRKRRDAASLLLVLWIAGTMLFAVVVNWDVNARTILPLIPAVAILIARRVEEIEIALASPVASDRISRKTQVSQKDGRTLRQVQGRLWGTVPAAAVCLIVSAAISLWVAAGDMAMAQTARTAAGYVRDKTREDSAAVWFEGRWGFEYYMQQFGARAVEPDAEPCRFGDLIVIPKYNTAEFKFPLKTTQPETIRFDAHTRVTAMNPDAGAGFYFSGWGPLPFVFGRMPAQEYLMARVLQNGSGQ